MECLYLLRPTVNQYTWGKKGKESLVYRLFEKYLKLNGSKEKNLDLDGPFSELWLGTHQSSPSSVINPKNGDSNFPLLVNNDSKNDSSDSKPSSGENVYLSQLISDIYHEAQGVLGKELKILLKVLSIEKPLSIQVHPDDETAADLFSRKHPGIVDSSSKPEMCIPLTKFRALLGFREPSEIQKFSQKHPEFAQVLGKDLFSLSSYYSSFYSNLVKKFFSGSDLGDLAEKLSLRLKTANSLEQADQFFLVLYNNYGSDPGVFFPFVLNCVELDPGQAIYLAPNTIHSYVSDHIMTSGDCVEIMRNSDNVVRCGLTDKFKDSQLLVTILETRFKRQNLQDNFVVPTKVGQHTLMYEPSDEYHNFVVLSISLSPGEEEDLFVSNDPFLCVVISSNDQVMLELLPSSSNSTNHTSHSQVSQFSNFRMGDCFLLSPNSRFKLKNPHSSDHFKMFLSYEKS